MWLRKPVPGANILTDVATKNPIFKFALLLEGNFLFQFNGKIGYAFASINNVRLRNGIRWASIHASRACAAIIFKGTIVVQRKIKNHFSQKEKAAHASIEQQRILSDPAQAGFLCPCAL